MMAPAPLQPAAAVLSMVASALFFALMGVCVKLLGGRIPVAEVVLARGLVSVVLSWWLLRRAGVNPWGRRRGLLIWRGLIGTAALLCVYQALAVLPIAAATVIQYLYPSFTALLAWLTLGEAIGPRVLLAMGLGWLGVFLLAQPAGMVPLGGLPLPLPGVLVGVLGALCTAIAYVSVRSLRHSEHPLVIVFYFPLVALVICGPLTLLNPVLPTPTELAALLGVGLFTQLGQLTVTRGLMALPAAQATAISYVQVAFAVGLGWLLFAEPFDGATLGGAALVLAATLVSVRRSASGAA
jgi:drug/metabolite transporter (DMT)-like permease